MEAESILLRSLISRLRLFTWFSAFSEDYPHELLAALNSCVPKAALKATLDLGWPWSGLLSFGTRIRGMRYCAVAAGVLAFGAKPATDLIYNFCCTWWSVKFKLGEVPTNLKAFEFDLDSRFDLNLYSLSAKMGESLGLRWREALNTAS